MANRLENIREINKRQTEEKNKKLADVMDYICKKGEVSIKDIAIDLKLPSNSVRNYVEGLLNTQQITRYRKGLSYLYKPFDKKQENAEPMTVSEEGKVLNPGEYIPVTTNCKPGDVIWISSRSGEGQFFRYLIITPWERKAMVLGLIKEGSPTLDLNDPMHVYIGKDPKTGDGLYADIRNVCQRGYKCFGERVMHIDKDYMDDVKCRLARSMCIDRTIKQVVDGDTERLERTIQELQKKNEGLIGKYDEAMLNKESEINELKDEIQKTNTKLSATEFNYDECRKELEEVTNDRDRLYEELHSNAEHTKEIENQVNKELVSDMQDEIENLQKTLGQFIKQATINGTKVELLERERDNLNKIIFSMIQGGQ